jgi:DHA3 family macrolide efflux protein-like MFS transporter
MMTLKPTHQRFLMVTSFIALSAGTGMAVLISAILFFIESNYQQSKLVALCSIVGQIACFLGAAFLGKMADSPQRIGHLHKTYFIGFMMVLLLASAAYVQKSTLYGLMLVFAVLMLIRLFDQIVRMAAVHEFVDPTQYTASNKILETVRQSITFVSGGFALFFIQKDTVLWASLLCCVCFLVALILSFKLENGYRAAGVMAKKADSVSLTWRTLAREANFTHMMASLIPYAVVLSMNTLYPKAFIQTGAEPTFYAGLVVPYGLGALLGSGIRSQLDRCSFEHHLFFLLVLFTVAMIAYAHQVFVLYGLIFIFSFCHASIRVRRNVELLLQAQRGQIGQLNSFYEKIAIVLTVVVSLLATTLADALGLKFAILFIAFNLALASLPFGLNWLKNKN